MANGTEVLAEVVAEKTAADAAAMAAYWDMARKVAGGTKPKAAAVSAALAAAGKSTADFEADTKYVVGRIELRRRLDSAPGLRKQRDELERDLAARVAELDAVRTRVQKEVESFQEQRVALDQRVEYAERAKSELLRGIRDDDPRKVRDGEIGKRLVYLQNRVGQLGDWLFETAAKAELEGDAYKSVREGAAAELPKLRRMLDDAQAEQQALKQERAALDLERLNP